MTADTPTPTPPEPDPDRTPDPADAPTARHDAPRPTEPVAPPQQAQVEPVQNAAPTPPAPPAPTPAPAPSGPIEGLAVKCDEPRVAYPTQSRRVGEEGTVTLRLVIDTRGVVSSPATRTMSARSPSASAPRSLSPVARAGVAVTVAKARGTSPQSCASRAAPRIRLPGT